MRLFINLLGFWIAVSAAIYLFTHMTNREQFNVGKALLFGFVTAAITGGILTAITVLF